MAETPSTMLPLGTPVPDFQLLEPATGKVVRKEDLDTERGILVVFLSNHCPYVKHIAHELADFAREYMDRGLAVVGIMSNDVEGYPADAPDRMVEEVRSRSYPFPYLYDESQEVAKRYRAACTPDFFLFDGNGRLAYRGQFDASRPGNEVPVTGEDLRAAADAVLAGRDIPDDQIPSVGCNIKWKAGNAPDYFG